MTRMLLKEGLDVRDARLKTLRRLFSEMQRYTVETCGADDLLEFVGNTAYFATIEDSESELLYSTSYQLEHKPLAMPSASEDGEGKVGRKLLSTFEQDEDIESDSGSDEILADKPSPRIHKLFSAARRAGQKLSVPSLGQTVEQKTGGVPSDSDRDSEFTGWDSDDSGWIPGHSEPPISTDAGNDTWTERSSESSPPVAGFLYLLPTYTSPFVDTPAELSVGIILDTPFRRLGVATDALEKALNIAFQKLKCHRVQAQVVDGHAKNIALKLFTKMRFGHEGTRRRSFYSPYAQEWKDTTCLAMLATDWASVTPVPSSAWDEMFLRHDRERNSLLRWEDRIVDEQRQLLRSSSTETIRNADTTKEIKSERTLPAWTQCPRKDEARSTISHNGSSTLVAPSYGDERSLSPEFFILGDPEYQTEDEDKDVDSDHELEEACRMLPPLPKVSLPKVSRPVERSVSNRVDDGYASSSDGSQWDMVERASTASPFDNSSDEEEDTPDEDSRPPAFS